MRTKTRIKIFLAVVIFIAILLLIPQFGRRRQGLKAAFDAEFLTRQDGYAGLRNCYDLKFASEPVQMDPGLMYRAIADGAVDVIDGFATDGRITAYNLVILEDDKGFFPPYYAAPLIRKETLEEYPKLNPLLASLSGKISDGTMQELNFEVDEKGRKAENVAREFLISNGLILQGTKPGNGAAGTITVGGKQFTEQEILGQIMAVLIECNSNIRVIRKLNLGGTMICFNALKAGDLDLYPEYTGTGLVNILKRKVITDPDKAYDCVRQAFLEEYGLLWLKPFGFNNTYTLTMRQQHAERLGIVTISDIAKYTNDHRSQK
ncbi:MAG: glycine betaine ABC transporter substrate-binding protein [Phycisphaerales bacterium]